MDKTDSRLTTLTKRFQQPSAFLCYLLTLTFVLYLRGLGGDFIFDDLHNIEYNPRAQLHDLSWNSLRQLWGSGVASELGRPLSMLSFGLNYYFAEHNVWWYKLTNLVLHLATTVAIYQLSLAVLAAGQTQRRSSLLQPATIQPTTIALLISACWALHPLHASTVLYVVQRMTQLSALFTVLALLVYCRFRLLTTPSIQTLVTTLLQIAVFVALAVLGKETGALAIPLMLLLEWCFFGWRCFGSNCANPQQRRFLQWFSALFVVVPLCAALGFVVLKPDYLLAAYRYRSFTLTERLLTESRVLWDYIGWILTPNPNHYTFFHDNYPLSTSLTQPLSTLAAVSGLVALLGVVVAGRKRLPWLNFGIGFFLISQLLESSILPLELVFEHRNYLPAYGLLFGLIMTVVDSPLLRLSKSLIAGFCAAFLALLALGVWQESRKWSSTPDFLLTLEQRLPNSQRVQYNLGYMYLKLGKNLNNSDYVAQAQQHFGNSATLDTAQFGGLIGLVLTHNVLNEAIPPEQLSELMRRVSVAPLNTGSIMDFINLTRCYVSRQCQQQPQLLVETYRAIGANTAMDTVTKQVILNEIASDVLLGLQLVDDALALFYYTESLSPELTLIDLRIIVTEMQKGDFAKARTHLAKAQQKAFVSTSMQQALSDLEKQLNTGA
jgi:protein O-mannosyl-transferase